MLYKATVSFSGIASMVAGEVKELTDKYSVLLEKYNALLKAMSRR